MPYPYLGDTALTYTQYLDADSGTTLTAQPGGAYLMTPATGRHEMAVPPGDGLWGAEITGDELASSPFGAASTEAAAAAGALAVAMDGTAPETGPGQDAPPPARTSRNSKAAQAAGQGG